ncbi:MAG: beta-propeller fold lactonase family protein [Candidatus Heimdallarchaeota archaeon]
MNNIKNHFVTILFILFVLCLASSCNAKEGTLSTPDLTQEPYWVLVSSTDDGTISFYDGLTLENKGGISVGLGRHWLDYSSENEILYVTNIETGNLSVMQFEPNEIQKQVIEVGYGPSEIKIHPDGNLAYIVQRGLGIIVDITSNLVVGDFQLVGDTPNGIEFSEDGSEYFIPFYNSNELIRYSTETNEVIDSYELPGHPMDVEFLPGTNNLYIPIDNPPLVLILDTDSGEVIHQISNGTHPQYVTFSPDSSLVIIPNAGTDNVSVIETKTNKVIKTIDVGDTPFRAEFSPDGDLCYILNLWSNNVSVIDIGSMKVIDTFSVQDYPNNILVVPNNYGISLFNEPETAQTLVSNETLDPSNDISEDLNDKSYAGFVAYIHNSDIYIMNSDGFNTVNVTNTNDIAEMNPKISFDGKKILFQILEDSNIYLIDSDGNNRVQVTSDLNKYDMPAWSPDDRIVFVLKSETNKTLMIMDIDGSNQKILVEGESPNTQIFDPVFSPGGELIAFSYNFDIYIMNSDGTNLTQLTTDSKWATSPSFSPDGNRLVYSDRGIPECNRCEKNEIFVMDIDGTNKVNISNNPEYDQSPTWSASNNRIIFVSKRDGTLNISSIDPDGSNFKQLTFDYGSNPNAQPLFNEDADTKIIKSIEIWKTISCEDAPYYCEDPIYYLSWSADNRYIAAQGWGDEFRIWDIINGATFGSAGHFDVYSIAKGARWSDDGKSFAVFNSDKVAIKEDFISSARYVINTDNPPSHIAWSPNNRDLAIAQSRQNYIIIADTYLETQIIINLTEVSHVTGLIWSPDGKKLGIDEGRYLHIWDIEDQRIEVIYDLMLSPAWSPSGNWIAGKSGDFIDLINIKTNDELEIITTGFNHSIINIGQISWSPDGNILATANVLEITLWDALNNFEKLITLTGFDDPVTSLAFSPNGKYLASGTDSSLLYIWTIPDIFQTP